MNSNDMKVYEWFKSHADGDGFVETACIHISAQLNIPLRTVHTCLQRLEETNKVFLIGYRRFAVTELVD
jgi:hypothetical protein